MKKKSVFPPSEKMILLKRGSLISKERYDVIRAILWKHSKKLLIYDQETLSKVDPKNVKLRKRILKRMADIRANRIYVSQDLAKRLKKEAVR